MIYEKETQELIEHYSQKLHHEFYRECMNELWDSTTTKDGVVSPARLAYLDGCQFVFEHLLPDVAMFIAELHLTVEENATLKAELEIVHDIAEQLFLGASMINDLKETRENDDD
jgi:hypothetical protein